MSNWECKTDVPQPIEHAAAVLVACRAARTPLLNPEACTHPLACQVQAAVWGTLVWLRERCTFRNSFALAPGSGPVGTRKFNRVLLSSVEAVPAGKAGCWLR